MSSKLPEITQLFLHTIGFQFVKADPRTQREHWLSQGMLPHVEVALNPTEECTTGDIVRAIFDAGARDQRERTRTAYNRLVETFRGGEHVAPVLDLLHLAEHVPSPKSSPN